MTEAECLNGKQCQPDWHPPRPLNSLIEYWSKHYPLKLYNSLTRTKNHFIPIHGKRVLWYMCGPTVYDQTHLGHGRTYTCFDYARRILEDYFGYEVELVMNITDIDDKIIIRAAENGWKQANPGEDLPTNTEQRVRKVMEWASEQSAEENMKRTKDLSQFWEASFLHDMASLGIKIPTVITRVSEYVDDIILLVQGIINNGFAYESNGSVYFDTNTFSQSSGKAYGKLLPENIGQSDLLAEGEGSLAANPTLLGNSDKRGASDFVLWKKSKNGEPFWVSPWGPGRPGWHIECSAMASSTLQRFADGQIDIHSGGIDLRFPHHDNEIAQSEAYFNFSQWINYFLHTGHLNIEGLKMSKSLKNFVKIKDALMDHSSRQLRFLFLLHKYNVPMDYNDHSVEEAVVVDRFFNEFFQNVKVQLRLLGMTNAQRWEQRDIQLHDAIVACKENVHQALANDLNTPQAILHLQQLAKEVSRYMASSQEHNKVSLLIRSAAEYVTSIFRIFGLIQGGSDIGFPLTNSSEEGAAVNEETILTPVLDIFSEFRDEIRELARAGTTGEIDGKALAAKILHVCDSVRDEKLPHAGIRLEDRANTKAIWKLANKDELLEEQRKKAIEKERKEEEKRQRMEEAVRKNKEAEEKAKIDPKEMFLAQKDKYSKFDDQGLPTHDTSGEALSKGQQKRLSKEQAKQRTLYLKYQEAGTLKFIF
uniref:cysteine--tRNA ligase n=1 Tax=Albugo laibachii Nc14 TaxID=890382 RepID=F0VZF5_9STRA|nr:cysteinyltRNA synthetase putative [Albugo laibachii Nc14]|eukprot:CCA14185.1 cysteinyltRNA synthetase putative [Albugo laibachii Nc14]